VVHQVLDAGVLDPLEVRTLGAAPCLEEDLAVRLKHRLGSSGNLQKRKGMVRGVGANIGGTVGLHCFSSTGKCNR